MSIKNVIKNDLSHCHILAILIKLLYTHMRHQNFLLLLYFLQNSTGYIFISPLCGILLLNTERLHGSCCCCCVAAPVGSALSAYFGPRHVVIVGGLLSSVGMVAGSYAQDLLQLYITVGFLTGEPAASDGAYGCPHLLHVQYSHASEVTSLIHN